LIAFGPYRRGSPLRDWILAFKHGGRPDLARPLAAVLAGALAVEEAGPDPLLVPVPLHPLRRLERGYDQASLLAAGVAEVLRMERAAGLRRRRWTPPQGSAGARSRSANLADAFEVVLRHRSALARRRVFLVDDVVTSGATAGACATALRAAGASEVHVLALARVELGAEGDRGDADARSDRATATLAPPQETDGAHGP
jgi:ComF family protein